LWGPSGASTFPAMTAPRSPTATESAIRGPLGTQGLRILADITGCLHRGLSAEEALAEVVATLGRGLGTDLSQVWVRTPDGAGFRAVTPLGTDPPPAVPADAATPWFDQPGAQRNAAGRPVVRMPLSHEGERLGMLEVGMPERTDPTAVIEVIEVTANVLALLIASVELSEDLASEIAMRTREIESQRRFTSKIIDSLPLGLYVIDRQYRIQAWNRKRETGAQGVVRDEVMGRSVFDVLYRQPKPLLKAEFDRAFEFGEMTQMDVESTASGETRHYRLTKVPMRLDDEDAVTHVITIGEDITEWKRVQDQVSQTEKLAAVGQLAAGVMHEINNPLATIGACVEALDFRVEDLSPVDAQGLAEYLRIIGSELDRCKAIVNGLLDFSRPKARVKRQADLNQILEDALFLVKHHHKYRSITLQRTLASDLPLIEANHEQLIQVFLSLMLNAIDAMEGEGVLSVRTDHLGDGSHIVAEFRDTGAGIPRDALGKIFEPFFTTKQPGRGTGLGLSICYGIVQEHGGRIAVESQPGRGSVFQVVLPVRQTGADA
jgi:two-component system NtrC family sensor kinase